jgi:site-specific DNA-methyltransferase (adenine-specific)
MHRANIRKFGSASRILHSARTLVAGVALAPSLAASVFWTSPDGRATLVNDDCLRALAGLPEASIDVVFADPPYFLSNGGTTCKSGKRVSVDKGAWDKSLGIDDNHEFNRTWLAACRRVLRPNGTIWVSGTSHVIYSVGFAMQQLGFKLLNEIVWEKPNPPPNLSCRYFTHSTETVLWAARDRKSKHHFDYAAMRIDNGGKQMKSVWRMTAPGKQEKLHGNHPTQKPLELLTRIVRAACPADGIVLDPFNGSGTTGVAALRLGRAYVGIDLEPGYLALTRKRIEAEIELPRPRATLRVAAR